MTRSTHKPFLNGAFSMKFELNESQLGEYYWRQLVLFCSLYNFPTLAAVGRELLVAGLRAKNAANLINEKLESLAKVKGVTTDEMADIVLANQGYTVKNYNRVLKKHNCKTVDELMIKLDQA
jgi:hypothetical protein